MIPVVAVDGAEKVVAYTVPLQEFNAPPDLAEAAVTGACEGRGGQVEPDAPVPPRGTASGKRVLADTFRSAGRFPIKPTGRQQTA